MSESRINKLRTRKGGYILGILSAYQKKKKARGVLCLWLSPSLLFVGKQEKKENYTAHSRTRWKRKFSKTKITEKQDREIFFSFRFLRNNEREKELWTNTQRIRKSDKRKRFLLLFFHFQFLHLRFFFIIFFVLFWVRKDWFFRRFFFLIFKKEQKRCSCPAIDQKFWEIKLQKQNLITGFVCCVVVVVVFCCTQRV